MKGIEKMGKITLKIAEKIAPRLSESQWQLIEEWNSKLDDESKKRYYKMVAGWENCSINEAMDLCVTNVTYRLGLKACSPAVIEMLKIPDGSGIERFKQWLDPEELALFMSPECPHTPEEYTTIYALKYKKMEKKMKRKGMKA